jgi:hypothetical protein
LVNIKIGYILPIVFFEKSTVIVLAKILIKAQKCAFLVVTILGKEISKMPLTPKQEKFCQCVVSGMAYKDAYLASYDWNGSEAAAYQEATRLALREDIQERIQALRKPITSAIQTQVFNETERIKQILWEEIENARTQQDHAAIARYTDQLNKLNNAYKDAGSTQDSNNDLDALDTNMLKRITKLA